MKRKSELIDGNPSKKLRQDSLIQEKNNLQTLPSHIWHHILFYLCPIDSLSFSLVCRDFHYNLDENFWKHWVTRLFGFIPESCCQNNFKNYLFSQKQGSVIFLSPSLLKIIIFYFFKSRWFLWLTNWVSILLSRLVGRENTIEIILR
jgi:hypothetical protein